MAADGFEFMAIIEPVSGVVPFIGIEHHGIATFTSGDSEYLFHNPVTDATASQGFIDDEIIDLQIGAAVELGCDPAAGTVNRLTVCDIWRRGVKPGTVTTLV